MKRKYISFFLIFSVVSLFSSCEKSQVARTYKEVNVETSPLIPVQSEETDPHAGMNMPPNAMMDSSNNADPHAGFTKEQLAKMLQETLPQNELASNSPIIWTVPDNWQENPASGMRVATFVNKNDQSGVDCSIVALGGGAGGLEPNILRWLGQLNIAVPQPADLASFMQKQEKLNIDQDLIALLFDFTDLQKDAPDVTPSMLAAIIDTPEQRIFVKMTGVKQKIIAESKAFKQLVQSIKFK